jgi:chemotaxis response regulator CheB
VQLSPKPVAEHEPTVLIVDDDPHMRNLLKLMMDSDGLEVVGEAADGVEAVTVMRETQPEVIILDAWMPRMNGEMTAKAVRKLCPNCRIVAFSAVLDTKPEWADAFLNKSEVSEMSPLVIRLMDEPSGHRIVGGS